MPYPTKLLRASASAGTFAAALIVTLAAVPAAWAEEKANTLELHRIMEEMGRNMQGVTAAIAEEDWNEIVRLAPLIADHPQPPAAEKVRILSFLGPDAARFRGLDAKVHESANGMKAAALRNDGTAVIDAFANVQKNCLACHQDFRQRFTAHFYGKP